MPRLSHQLSQTRKTAWSTFTHLFWVQKQNNFEQGSKTQVTEETQVQIPDVEIVNIDDLRSDGQNPNRMTAQQTSSLILNIKRYGFIVPIVTNKDLLIADGEQRWNAAKTLGMKTVSIIRLPVEDVDRRLLRQTLNKIRGEHVLDQDVAEYQLIMDAGRRDDLKSLLGLEDKQLRALMRREILFSQNNQNFVPSAPSTTNIKPGDIFELGTHRLMCGDSTISEDVKKLLGNESVDCIQADPPYGVYGEEWTSLRHRKMAVGDSTYKEVAPADYLKFTKSWLDPIQMAPTNTFYIWINQRNLVRLLEGLESSGYTTTKMLVWVKHALVLTNQDCLSRHELCAYGWKGKHKFYGKKRDDIFFVDRPTRSVVHPTMKPVELIQPLIEDGSQVGATIYDPFGGSGTTLVAAHKTNRRCFMMEKEPIFCDVIVRRYKFITNQPLDADVPAK